MELYEKLKELIKKSQDNGVPLFFVRDPRTKLPSVSLTLMIISFLFVIVSLVNAWAQFVKGVDPGNSLELFMVTAGLYFGRSLSNKTRDVGKIDEK